MTEPVDRARRNKYADKHATMAVVAALILTAAAASGIAPHAAGVVSSAVVGLLVYAGGVSGAYLGGSVADYMTSVIKR